MSIIHKNLPLPQRRIRTILTLKQYTPAFQAFQRMPSSFFQIEASQFTIGVQGRPLRLVTIVVIKHPLDLATDYNDSFR